MKVQIWGVRGSIPVPGAGTLHYGGNTPCVQVIADHPSPNLRQYFIFDGGSGIRLLGNQIAAELAESPDIQAEAHIFLTHVHWDHIQGIPFFKPLYTKGVKLFFYGPDYSNVKGFLDHLMYPNFFPISVDHADVKSQIVYEPLPPHEIRIGEYGFRYHYVNHGDSDTVVGYRVESPMGSFVFIPDVEPTIYPLDGENPAALLDSPRERQLSNFIQGADMAILDTTFTPEEYEKHRGWGHSPWDYAVEIAALSKVKCLGLYHYEPMREDADVDRILAQAQALGKRRGVDVFASREGLVFAVQRAAEQKQE